MFTGIIEEVGEVLSLRRGARSFSLRIKAQRILEGSLVGDSIATNGVCLTITQLDKEWFEADVMPETVERTSLRALNAGAKVNLERALTPTTRLGGHFVAGHVDTTGRIIDLRRDDTALWIRIEAPASLLRYVVEKGSIAIDGVSLTVARVDDFSLSVSLIPHTQGVTTLHERRVGEVVNLEADMLAKYVEKLVGGGPSKGLTLEYLQEHGF